MNHPGHTHFSATAAAGAFLSVVLLGTLWRLVSAHLAASSNTTLATTGAAMAAQY